MPVVSWIRAEWDRTAAIVLVVLGAATLLVGWIGTSGTAYPAEQLPYILSGGIGGMFLLGLGAVLWLSADLRDEWRKLDRIEEALRADLLDGKAPSTNGSHAGAAAVAGPDPMTGDAGGSAVAQHEPPTARKRRPEKPVA